MDPTRHPEPAVTAVGTGAPLAPVPVTRAQRLRTPLVTGAVVTGLTLALHLRDPHSAGSWGECPWLAITGLYCPGCGGLRAVNDLTNGDVGAALSSNLVFVVMVPVLVLWWLRWTQRAWTGEPSPAAPRGRTTALIAVAVLVTVVFCVLRNTAFGSWLAP